MLMAKSWRVIHHASSRTSESEEIEPTAREKGVRRSGRRGTVALLAVVVIIVLAGATVYGFVASSSPVTVSTTSTYYTIGPDVIVSGAVQQNPSGYSLESRGNPASNGGTRSGDWAVLGNADGSLANLTVIVFSSTNASQSYFSRVVAELKGLPGYTDITSALSAYQQYGRCYGYGEDVDNIAVINGVCTKGNVLLQVHLVSSKAFGDLEADLTSLMGTLYQSVG